MGEKKLPKFLTMKDLQTNIINWSDEKIRRKIKSEGFPAKQEANGRYVFETSEVEDWFKRRTVKP